MHIHHGPTGSAPMITKVQMAAPGAAARTHTATQTLSVKVISVSLQHKMKRTMCSVRGRPRHTGERRKTCCRNVIESRKEYILDETL